MERFCENDSKVQCSLDLYSAIQDAIVANGDFSFTEISDRKHVIILVVTVAGSGVDLKCTISVGYICLSLGPSYDKDGIHRLHRLFVACDTHSIAAASAIYDGDQTPTKG